MRKVINEYGDVFYYNEKNESHREDGPAVEYANGYKAWYRNGKLHREDGPAVEYANGNKYWYKNGKLHREDGLAIEYANGKVRYYYNNIYYSEIETDEEWMRFIKLMVFQ